MRIVVALGGNALARRGEPMTASTLQVNARRACEQVAEQLGEHELVVTHGNGPQVGLLALQNLAYPEVDPYPLDMLGAQTQGMLGYVIQQELEVALAGRRPVATVVTTTTVDVDDPAFEHPTKFIGPTYPLDAAEELTTRYGWTVAEDGHFARRVVPSPVPLAVRQAGTVRLLLDHGHVVVAVGGGGVAVVESGTQQIGQQAVVDKDLASAVLARELDADVFLMLTDGSSVCEAYGTPQERAIRSGTPDGFSRLRFAAGSMQPKMDAAMLFARGGGRALIGSLEEVSAVLGRRAGTEIALDAPAPIEYYEAAGARR